MNTASYNQQRGDTLQSLCLRGSNIGAQQMLFSHPYMRTKQDKRYRQVSFRHIRIPHACSHVQKRRWLQRTEQQILIKDYSFRSRQLVSLECSLAAGTLCAFIYSMPPVAHALRCLFKIVCSKFMSLDTTVEPANIRALLFDLRRTFCRIFNVDHADGSLDVNTTLFCTATYRF